MVNHPAAGAGPPPIGRSRANPTPLTPRKPASPGFAGIAIGVAGLCGLLFAGDLGYQMFGLARLNNELKAERAESQREHDATLKQEQTDQARQDAEDEAKQQTLLHDEGVISGALARQRHEEEWARRLSHDPEVAKSAMETTLLHMQKVGHDPTRTAQEALAEVAQLAAPPGSRIEVTPSGDRFAVRVAFRMSALSANETGAVTKHHSTRSMQQEIEKLSAEVTKALFDYCGSRGIEKLSVTCNHALRRTLIPPNATESERAELLGRAPVAFCRLYRVSLDWNDARSVPDWRSITERKVISMMTVELNELKTLTISGTGVSPALDPEGQLEY